MAATAWRSLTAFGMTFLGNGAWDRGHGSVVRRNGSAAAEFRLAAFEERARAFAHVVGGEHQAELRGLVLHCFVQRAIGADVDAVDDAAQRQRRSEEHTSELQSLMRTSYAVLCLKKNTNNQPHPRNPPTQHTHINDH